MLQPLKCSNRFRNALWAILFSTAFATPLAAQDDANTVQLDAEAVHNEIVESIANAVIEAAIDEQALDAETGLSSEILDPNIDPTELEHRLIPLTQPELGLLAAEWLEIVRIKTLDVMAAQIAIDRTDGEIEQAARDQLTELAHDRKLLFDKYAKVIAAWEKKGGPEDAIAEYRAYRSAIIIEETRTADFKTLLAEAGAWLISSDGGVDLGKGILILILSLAFLLLVARVIRRVAFKWLGRIPTLSKLLQVFLVATIYWIVLAIGLLIVLSAVGIDITPAFALIGGASFILAFAFQDTLGNLASGFMIMVNRPFDEGDYVDLGGVGGTVRAVSVFATTVVTPDNQIIVVPNRNVWGSVMTNYTASDTRRVDLTFGISYEDSISDAIRVMDETVKAHPLVLDEPESVIRVHQLADSSVNFICRPWVKTSDYWTLYWDLHQQIKEAFDVAGITVPFPQRDVHLKGSKGSPASQN